MNQRWLMDGTVDFGHLRPVYLYLLVSGGQIGLPILILTYFFSKNVIRHPTLVNLWITWVIYSISYSILIYSGQTGNEARYPPSLACRAQSAMTHGAPAMSATAGLIVVMQTWFTFQEPQQMFFAGRKKWAASTRLVLCLALPYFVFFVFTLASALVGNHYLETMNGSNGLYCTLQLRDFGRYGVPAYCTAVVVLLICFEAIIAFRYLRQRRHIAQIFPLADRTTSASRALVLRILLFNLYSIIVISAGIIFMSGTVVSWPFMVQAALPLAAVLVFGSQKDLFRVWCFWKNIPTPDSFVPAHPISRQRSESVYSGKGSISTPSVVHLANFRVPYLV